MIVKHVFKRPYFLSVTPNISWVGENLTLFIHIDDHDMGLICKEGCICKFLINFSFGWLQNLTTGTFGWMLDHSSYLISSSLTMKVMIKSENRMHPLPYSYYRSLHYFLASLEVLWALILFCFISSIFCIVALPESLGKEDPFNYILASSDNNEGISTRGVIFPTIWSLLPSHIRCNGKFNLVMIFSLSDRAHQSTYDWLLCSSMSFI